MSASVNAGSQMNSEIAMPLAIADLSTTWAFLEPALDHIMNFHKNVIPYPGFMACYTAAYNYCACENPRSAGAELYNKLVDFFIDHLRPLKDASDPLTNESLLRYYTNKWDHYTTGADYINRLFTYLNQHWVKLEKDEGRRNIYMVYTLALVQWRENFFMHIQSKQTNLTGAILRLIEQQRNGETIDRGLMKKLIDSLISLGIDDDGGETLDVYRDHFEAPFIETTEKYYHEISEVFLAENSVSDYLKKVERCLHEEEDMGERFLPASTHKMMVSRCEHVLIKGHAEIMWGEFQKLLDYDRDEDLQRMYALLSRIPESLEPLRKKFEEHVKHAGIVSVQELVGEGEAGVDELDSKAYVDTLLAVHRKNQEIVTRCFKGDAGFVASFDKACCEFVNRNAATGVSTTKSPELFAKYIDALLQKNNESADNRDLEEALK